MIQRFKAGSAVVAHREDIARRGTLRLAKGYGLYSVSPRNVNIVADYVRNQARRHPRLAIAEDQGEPAAVEQDR